ncbi:MAG: hypothetical protein J6S58_08410, partial [Lentisphaeria bacterium]|nr:hypothetical protein [Lentisphaeria bacterium]
PDCRSGVYSVEVSHGPYSKIQRVVNLTDLACSAAVDPVAKKAVAAVCSMKNNKPCAGAAVTLISGKHQVLARGTTNPAGIVMLDYSASAAGKDKEDSPEYLLVKSPSGVCTLLRNISNENHSLVPFRNRGHVYDAMPRAFIYTERGIYRPGEDLYVSLFLRDSTNKVCRNVPCTVKVSDPKGNVIGSARIKSGPYGFASARFILPADGFSGSYEIRCLPDGSGDPVWGTASFLVSEFTPDRIRVQLKGSGKTLFQGEKLSFQVQADHYYGAPLTKAPCRFQVSALPAALPSAWSSWSVGDKSAFQSGRGHLSAVQISQGSKTFVYKGFEASGGQAFFPVQLVASAQVRDPGGRTVTAQSHVLYHPFPYYIGLRSGKASALRSAAVEWKLLPAKMETPLSGKTKRTLKISLSRLEWHSVTRRMGSDLRLDWEQRKVPVPDAGSLTTEAVEGVWEKELESGQYEIVFEEGKLRTVLNFYHWRGDDTPRSSNPSVLHCFADKKLYKAGEEALLTFHSPGEGIVLVTGA